MTKIGRYQDKYFKSGPRSKPPNWEWVFWYYDKSPLWAESRIMRALPHPYKASTKKISKLPILWCIWGNVPWDCDKRDRGRRIMRARGHYDICPRSNPDKDWNLSLASTAAQKEENLKKKKKSKFSAQDFFVFLPPPLLWLLLHKRICACINTLPSAHTFQPCWAILGDFGPLGTLLVILFRLKEKDVTKHGLSSAHSRCWNAEHTPCSLALIKSFLWSKSLLLQPCSTAHHHEGDFA